MSSVLFSFSLNYWQRLAMCSTIRAYEAKRSLRSFVLHIGVVCAQHELNHTHFKALIKFRKYKFFLNFLILDLGILLFQRVKVSYTQE